MRCALDLFTTQMPATYTLLGRCADDQRRASLPATKPTAAAMSTTRIGASLTKFLKLDPGGERSSSPISRDVALPGCAGWSIPESSTPPWAAVSGCKAGFFGYAGTLDMMVEPTGIAIFAGSMPACQDPVKPSHSRCDTGIPARASIGRRGQPNPLLGYGTLLARASHSSCKERWPPSGRTLAACLS
jgi:hypothetical protein